MRTALSSLAVLLLVQGAVTIILRRLGIIHIFPLAGSLMMLVGYLLWRISRKLGSP